jgi:hypothetical protein
LSSNAKPFHLATKAPPRIAPGVLGLQEIQRSHRRRTAIAKPTLGKARYGMKALEFVSLSLECPSPSHWCLHVSPMTPVFFKSSKNSTSMILVLQYCEAKDHPERVVKDGTRRSFQQQPISPINRLVEFLDGVSVVGALEGERFALGKLPLLIDCVYKFVESILPIRNGFCAHRP